VEHLEQRRHIDAGRTQLITAQAALAERKSELIRASAAVRNAETRIRGLLNAPALGTTDQVELLPVDAPMTEFIPFQLYESVHTAVQHRPEILQAIKQIKAGCVRLNMAEHEMLPTLNMVTQMYVAGLKGSSDVGAAWVQQFSDGAPSYSLGLEYELPVGRRASSARLQRRRIELRQLNGQYRNALETVKNEVEVAVREVNTAYDEMRAKALAMEAARQEANSLQARWLKLANVNTSAVLTLEALLRAQERSTQTEFDFLSAQLTYNLALIHMKRAMGVLVSMDCRGQIASIDH
jgi:outer membrane protein TolC